MRVWSADQAIDAALAGRIPNSVATLGLLWLYARRDALRARWMDLMTERLFLDEPRLRSATATVLASGPDGVVLDRTMFYARSGGQPGDLGTLRWPGGGDRGRRHA